MTDERIEVDVPSSALHGVNAHGWHIAMTRRLNAISHHHSFSYTLGTHAMDDGCVLVVFDPKVFTQIPHGPLPHTVAS